MIFHLRESHALRTAKRDDVGMILHRRRVWREDQIRLWQKSNIVLITQQMEDDLLEMWDFLQRITQDHKVVIESNHVRIYTNDVAVLTAVDQMSCLSQKEFSEANITRPRDTVMLQNPQHRYRMYFRNCRIDTVQQQRLTKFLQRQQDQIRLSPGLRDWISLGWLGLQSHFFVDHNDPGFELMLALVHPGARRKTLDIIASP